MRPSPGSAPPQRGNFEGANILVRGEGPEPAGLPEWRRRLYEARAQRVWPGLDDKRLTAWNALAISALADAGAALRAGRLPGRRAPAPPASCSTELREAATAGCCAPGRTGSGRLNAYLEDHAFLLEALLTLYEATFEPRWFAAARELADTMIERFADDENGGFFETSADHEQLVARRKDLEDHPIPSGNSSAAYGLLRLAALTGEHEYERRAESALRLLHQIARQAPAGVRPPAPGARLPPRPGARGGAGGTRTASRSSACCGPRFRPHLVLAGGEPDGVPLLEGRDRGGRPRRGLRVRALRLPRAGHRAGGAGTAALLARARPPGAERAAGGRLLRGHRHLRPRAAAGGERGRGPRPPAHAPHLPPAPGCGWPSRASPCPAAGGPAT